MIYLFLEGDEYLISKKIKDIKANLGDPDMADMNTSVIVGNKATAADVLSQSSMMPFLATRRLIVVEGMLAHLDQRMSQSKRTDSTAHNESAQLLEGLQILPDTCDLLFLEPKGVDKRRALWKGFSLPKTEKKPARKITGLQELAKQQQIQLESPATPEPKVLPGWIQQQAKSKKISIEPQAVQLLANFVGPNLRLLDNELEKLYAYTGGRSINADDIKDMVSDASEALIWDLTDALSQRNGRKAMQSIYELRRGDANPFYLLTMIARQYRIIIKVKDAVGSSSSQGRTHNRQSEYDIAKRINERPFPVKKAMQQMRNYNLRELEMIMDRLLETDFAMKTG
ncbi:MAG: DNA polymerase III subunit delta, partial [Chloroflexota bacterium]